MNQLETAGALPATWLPLADIGSTEPSSSAQARTDDAPPSDGAADAEAADVIPYVSPPPMPWPRVFPSL